MPTPSGQISLDDIWIEPNPSWTSSESFGDIAYDSWAQGPLGSNTNSWNGWGNDGGNSGNDVIYNVGGYLQQNVDPINFANYSNKYYYFDGTNFDIKFSYNNTLTNPPPSPPNPPINNDVNVQVDCYDYSNTYSVHSSFNINAPANSSQAATPIPGGVTNSPLVENVYWSIIVNTDPNNTISNIAFDVNGTTFNIGGGGGSFTWQSAGASRGLTDSSGILYDVTVT